LEILWKSEEPLIALLDYMMPRMTGVDTLRYLAEDPERARRHTIVLMSGNWDYPERAAEVYPHAAMPFLAKPFTVTQLVDALDQANDQLHAGRVTHA
jgi:CheY-like chemotaxis protein